MKKTTIIQRTAAVAAALVLILAMAPQQASAAGQKTKKDNTVTTITNGRDDGVWLFPAAKGDFTSLTDWAGCSNNTTAKVYWGKACILCGKTHGTTEGSTWNDKCHAGQHPLGHAGLDVGINKKNILASAGGFVKVAHTTSNPAANGRGNYVVIEHKYDDTYSYYSVYQHLSSIGGKIESGKSVEAGDVIGVSGDSGSKNSFHLHFEILFGNKDFKQSLSDMEGGGWYLRDGLESYKNLNTKSGNKYGRIVSNPSAKTYEQYDMKERYSSIPAHAGSVTYTFDKAKVSIGAGAVNDPGDGNSHGAGPVDGDFVSVDPGTYIFVGKNGLCLNAVTDSNGGNINAQSKRDSSNQKWSVSKTGSNYRVTSVFSTTKRVLNAYTEKTSAAGTDVRMWQATGHATQLWLFIKSGDGYIIVPSDNTKVALTVLSDNNVKLAARTGASNQIWNLEPVR